MQISAQQAADVLGVSRMQISRLVRQGDIRANRFGNALLIDGDSVNQYRALRPERGRPLSAATAWTRIKSDSDQFSAPTAHSLADHELVEAVKHLAIMTRRRAQRYAFRGLPNRIATLLDDPRLVISGADAGQRHGAPAQPGGPHLVYTSRENLDGLIADHRLRADDNGPNVIIRTVASDEWILNHGIAPPLVAAIDAFDEQDSRSAVEIIRHANQPKADRR